MHEESLFGHPVQTDFVYVFDGASASARQLAQLGGTAGKDKTFSSTGTVLTVKLTSDNSEESTGFTATYTTTKSSSNIAPSSSSSVASSSSGSSGGGLHHAAVPGGSQPPHLLGR